MSFVFLCFKEWNKIDPQLLLEDTLIYENDTQYRMVSVGTFTKLGTLQNEINSYIFLKENPVKPIW